MPTNRRSFWLIVFALVSLLALSLACSKKKKAESDEEDTGDEEEVAAATFKPTGNEGSIAGTVSLKGTPAPAVAPKPIDMSSEASCLQNNPNPMTETVAVKDGKLANVFVYIKDGTTEDGKKIANLAFSVPGTEVVLDQKGCHYRPHVMGIQTGQTLKVTNSDTTTHNIHPQPAAASGNPEWNRTQPPNAAPIVETFKRPEVLIPVKCNQHNWMKSYIGVLKHPFYAVTAEDGSFEIKGVPPGTYTVETWQESYKAKSQQVTVPSKGVAKLDVSYDAAAPTAQLRDGSLKVMPALEFPMQGGH